MDPASSKEKEVARVTLFILKSQPGSLQPAENFLRNRDWLVESSTNLRETLAYVVQKRPQYVIITSDHPNRKVQSLPKLLMQALPVQVIGFSEKGSGASLRDLGEMGLEYNLYPPVSGPAIERMILKIQKEADVRARVQHYSELSRAGESVPSFVSFKGNASQPPIGNAASFEQAQAALQQMLGLGSDPDSNEEPAQIQKGFPGWFPQDAEAKDQKKASSGFAYTPQSGPVDTEDRANTADQNGGFSNARPAYIPDELDTENLGSHSRFPLDENHGKTFDGLKPSENPTSPSNHHRPSEKDGNTGSESENFERDQKPEPPASHVDSGAHSRKEKKAAPIMESEYVGRKGPKNYRMTSYEKLHGSVDSIIVKGAQAALEETVNLKDAEKPSKIEAATHIACITISSLRFSGYLVVAMGKNRQIDQNLLDVIQKRLFGFLKSNGENVKDDDSLSLKIEEVDFTDWALEQAQFLRKSVHDGDEIAMAFFPNKEPEISLEESPSEKMVKMHISDLKDNVPVEFDLYVFLPENNKYLLYTPKGKPLDGQQKSRLSAKGMTHMHLRKDAAHNVKKYKAQNFLNEKISAYKAKTKLK